MALPPPACGRRFVVTAPDPLFRDFLREVLRDEGYEACVPPTPGDPLAFIKAVRPGAVVLDAPFGRETATLGLLDTLRCDPATAALPVVVCTTAPEGLESLEGQEAEGIYLLAKPFDLEQLLTILATA